MPLTKLYWQKWVLCLEHLGEQNKVDEIENQKGPYCVCCLSCTSIGASLAMSANAPVLQAVRLQIALISSLPLKKKVQQ
ncbi:hypothetical protein [Synechococcus sp. PH41509]|uniref:hypothetical protein n=1 Tax=Synechococcus sp. PH41509 TaxID=2508342 RepID=UPI001E4DA677|nr:hypothetical protein [Synechococcus sp. PH41509]